MISYFGNFNYNFKNKFDTIFNKRNIKLYFENDYIEVTDNEFKQNYLIYHDENYKPSFVISNFENLDNLDDKDQEIKTLYEETNNKIDEYDEVDSVILEIYNKNLKYLEKNSGEKNINKKNFNKKNINKKNLDEFEKMLEDKKILLINKNLNKDVSTGIFSFRTILEMFKDQILKLYQNPKFDISIDDFPKIKILMSDFNFIGSTDLIIRLDIDIGIGTGTETGTETNSKPKSVEKIYKSVYKKNNKSTIDPILKSPKIMISSNKILKNNLIKVIMELKPFVDVEYWSIKYSLSDTVIKIYNMINTFGEIEQVFSSELDQIINDLEYLVSIKNINISEKELLELFDEDLTKTKGSNNLNNSNNSNNKLNSDENIYWKKGTGYGNDKTKKWNVEKYIKNLNEKKKNIATNFNNLIKYLSNNYNEKNKLNLIPDDIINRTVNLFVNYLENEEITEENVIKISDLIFNNFEIFIKDQTVNFKKMLNLLENFIKDNEINTKLFDENYNLIKNNLIKNNLTTDVSDKKFDNFSLLLDKYKYNTYQNEFSNFHYLENVTIDGNKLGRLKKEFNIIKKSIMVNEEASIFFWIEKNKLERMRFIISGPTNTPYDHGLYIFDMIICKEFPLKPPKVHFSNNGNKRFNPNLYENGKVCLSLLGTWNGDKGESWISDTSTFFQILISIQSLILIEEPFFNEPGYEKLIGKEKGIAKSKEYNYRVRKYNLDHAMNDLIENILNKKNYMEFEHIILNYFKYKKDKIIQILNKWENEYPDLERKNAFIASKKKFIELTNKL